MSRWGEGDKKSQGLWGCSIAFFVLGLTLYVFFINYQNLEGRRNLEEKMQSIVRTGYSKTSEQMIMEIKESSEELGLQLDDDAISLTKVMDEYNNPVVSVRIDFSFEVDLLVTQFDIAIPIVEDLTIVVF